MKKNYIILILPLLFWSFNFDGFRRTKGIILYKKVVGKINSLGTEVWIDSAEPTAVKRAGQIGAEGGTSNPALITKAIKEKPQYYKERIVELANNCGYSSSLSKEEKEEIYKNIVLMLTLELVKNALDNLKGPMSWEVDPRFHDDAQKMVAEAKQIYKLAKKNGIDPHRIFIKIPATSAGIQAVKQLGKAGINVNLTLVFTLAQAVKAINAFGEGKGDAKLVISPFLGRWDDYFKRMGMKVNNAGIYFAYKIHMLIKNLVPILKEKYGNVPRLVMASIRNIDHVKHLIGADILTIPPKVLFSSEFANLEVERKTINKQIEHSEVSQLYQLKIFYDSMENLDMPLSDFDTHPLVIEGNEKFIKPYVELLNLIRDTLQGP